MNATTKNKPKTDEKINKKPQRRITSKEYQKLQKKKKEKSQKGRRIWPRFMDSFARSSCVKIIRRQGPKFPKAKEWRPVFREFI